MDSKAVQILSGLTNGLFQAIRIAIYSALLLAGYVVIPVFKIVQFLGLITFLFCFLVRRDQTLPMLFGLGAAFGATLMVVLYESVLERIAPEGAAIVSQA